MIQLIIAIVGVFIIISAFVANEISKYKHTKNKFTD